MYNSIMNTSYYIRISGSRATSYTAIILDQWYAVIWGSGPFSDFNDAYASAQYYLDLITQLKLPHNIQMGTIEDKSWRNLT